jgi:hypothetical protein
VVPEAPVQCVRVEYESTVIDVLDMSDCDCKQRVRGESLDDYATVSSQGVALAFKARLGGTNSRMIRDERWAKKINITR